MEMKFFITWKSTFCSVLLFFVIGWPTSANGSGNDWRVIGGGDAIPHEFPNIVSLRTKNKETGELTHFCGGVILSKKWVLTAEHCWTKEVPVEVIVAGEHDSTVDEGTEQTVKPVQALRTPEAPPVLDKSDYDILLIEVDPPFEFNKNVAPVKLPAVDFEPSGTLPIAGWGQTTTESPAPPADVLQTLDIPVIPRDACQEYFPPTKVIHPWYVCVGFEDGHASPCFGDSGGPLYIKENGELVVVGLTSESLDPNCAAPDAPHIYTRVGFPYFIKWIRDVVGDELGPTDEQDEEAQDEYEDEELDY